MENLKQYNDPLYAGLRESRDRTHSDTEPRETQSKKNSQLLQVGGGLLIIALALLAYTMYQARERIDQLSSELAQNEGKLTEVTAELEVSKDHIVSLNDGLAKSSQQLARQGRALNNYRGLYEGLKSQQAEQVREIQAITIEKADVSEVNTLKQETSRLGEKVEKAREGIDRLNQTSTQNRSTIEQNSSAIETNRSTITEVSNRAAANTDLINTVKRSLEREYYNFELREKGGYMKVFSISLSLKDADPTKRQFDLYVLADGKVIQKKNHSVNEPILFYAQGKKKPFEVVVTRVDKKMVVGYLSVPKS